MLSRSFRGTITAEWLLKTTLGRLGFLIILSICFKFGRESFPGFTWMTFGRSAFRQFEKHFWEECALPETIHFLPAPAETVQHRHSIGTGRNSSAPLQKMLNHRRLATLIATEELTPPLAVGSGDCLVENPSTIIVLLPTVGQQNDDTANFAKPTAPTAEQSPHAPQAYRHLLHPKPSSLLDGLVVPTRRSGRSAPRLA
jgi:hypothetical protein